MKTYNVPLSRSQACIISCARIDPVSNLEIKHKLKNKIHCTEDKVKDDNDHGITLSLNSMDLNFPFSFS